MIGLVLAVALLGAAQGGAVLPGVLDLPLLDGAELAPECLGMRDRLSESGEAFACVGAPMSRVNDLAFAYVDVARERGWGDASGAANAIWMTRTLPDGRCQKLTIAGMWDFERTHDPRPGDPGFVLISLDADSRCPRPAQ